MKVSRVMKMVELAGISSGGLIHYPGKAAENKLFCHTRPYKFKCSLPGRSSYRGT